MHADAYSAVVKTDFPRMRTRAHFLCWSPRDFCIHCLAVRRLGLSPDEAIAVLRNLRSPLPSTSSPIAADDPTVRRPDPGTCPWPTYRCDVLSKYRSFDGSCNSLIDPIRGRSFTPFARYLPPDYADGMLYSSCHCDVADCRNTWCRAIFVSA